MTRERGVDDHEKWTGRLSEYIDGLLTAAEKERFDAHLAECGECRRVASELEAVKRAARELRDTPPDRDLWEGIRRSVEGATVIPLPAGERRRGLFLTLPQLATAATVLLALGGAAVWSMSPSPGTPGGDPAAETPTVAEVARDELTVRTAAVDQEIVTSVASEAQRLEELLASSPDGLDPGTVQVLEKNLAIIDRAITESLDALESDPGNPWVREHLRRSWERKVAYLRETTDYLDAPAAD